MQIRNITYSALIISSAGSNGTLHRVLLLRSILGYSSQRVFFQKMKSSLDELDESSHFVDGGDVGVYMSVCLTWIFII